MKVLVLTPQYLPSWGGIEVLVDSLAEPFRKCSIDTRVVTDDAGRLAEYEIVNGTPVHRLSFAAAVRSGFPGKPLAVLQQLAGIVESEHPDLLHMHCATGSSAWYVDRLLRKSTRSLSFIVTQHGVLEPSDRLKVVRDLLRRADALTAVSDAALQSAAQFSNHDGRQEIIANGIRPYQQPASLPGLPGLHRMVCVGRLEHEKGFDIAIRALAVARAEGLDATLTIVGCGEDRRKLEALASELGLAGSVHFRGACDNEETRRIMAGASVVLVPSRTREGFSLVAAEAALAGVPCVVSRIGGLPETVADGVTGFVVSPAQPAEFAAAAIRLFRHASLGADLGSRARARAGLKYNLDTCVEHYQQLYLSVLARAARGAGVTS